MSPPTLYSIAAPTDTPGKVHLHWQTVPGASGYEVFSTPDLDTPFAATPDAAAATVSGGSTTQPLPATATDAYVTSPSGSNRFYAVSSLIGGTPTLEHTVIQAAAGSTQPTGPADCAPSSGPASTVQIWQTCGDDPSHPFVQLPDTTFSSSKPARVPVISVDNTAPTRDRQPTQEITGFGATMTDTSAYLLDHATLPNPFPLSGVGYDDYESKLQSADEAKLQFKQLFAPAPAGAGLDFVRIPIGGNDYSPLNQFSPPISQNSYSEDELPTTTATDPTLAHFNIDHDEPYLIPALRAAKDLNPHLEFMATPWSAPAWMKTSDSLSGGTLRSKYVKTYAEYLFDFLEAYAASGIPIDYITIQNEPFFGTAEYPSMKLGVDQQEEIATALKRDLAGSDLPTKILGLDHNWAYITQAEQLAQSHAFAGIAFHCYGKGNNPENQTDLPNNVPIFDTECTPTGSYASPSATPPDLTTAQGTFGQDLVNNTRQEMIQAVQYGARSVMFWNIAEDESYGPTINTGCGPNATPHCLPLEAVDQSSGDGTMSVGYYVLEHASRFLQPDASHIASTLAIPLATGDCSATKAPPCLWSVAFRNPDGSIVLVVLNTGSAATSFAIKWSGRICLCLDPAELGTDLRLVPPDSIFEPSASATRNRERASFSQIGRSPGVWESRIQSGQAPAPSLNHVT